MISGRLTERVTLFAPVVSKDTFGADVISYPHGKTVHAEVNWKSGRLSEEASEIFPDGRLEVIIYDAHTVAEKWRLEYAGVAYTVGAIEHNRRRGFKRLICDKVND